MGKTLRDEVLELAGRYVSDFYHGLDIATGLQALADRHPSDAEARDAGIFCPQCFADEGSGSWNHAVIRTDKGGHCTNCGNGACVSLPKWAIESIRQQASWVGKRYYSHEEDKERFIERSALLALVPHFPGRTAERLADDPDPPSWNVSQVRPDGRQVQTIVRAPDAETAMRWSGLTYYAAIDSARKEG